MAKRNNIEYTCTVTFTEGWEKRVTEAFVDLYYKRQREGKPLLSETKEKTV